MPLKYFIHTTAALLFFCFVIACKENKTGDADAGTKHPEDSVRSVANAVVNTPPADLRSKDSIALTQLIRKTYAWKDTVFKVGGYFIPAKANPSDTAFASMDTKKNDSHIRKLIASEYFTQEFTDNYRRVVHYMDTSLRNGSAIWLEGELPPFNLDADIWCNCQDFPDDNYYDRMTISSLSIEGEKASFNWNIPEGHSYAVLAKKTDGKWKIGWLSGFDAKGFGL